LSHICIDFFYFQCFDKRARARVCVCVC